MNKTRSLFSNPFPTHLFQLRVSGGQSLSWQPRVQGRNPHWMGCPSIAGPLTHTYTHAHSDGDHVDTPVHPTCTSLGWGRHQRKPTQTWGEHANATRQWPQLDSVYFLINIIANQHQKKQHSSKTCCTHTHTAHKESVAREYTCVRM